MRQMRGLTGIRPAGSFTVEAAYIMAMVLLCISVMVHQAARIRDETAGAMSLHEAVEKGRHEKEADLEELAEAVLRRTGRPMTFSRYEMNLERHGNRILGSGQGGKRVHEIEAKRFRPETFLRRITLIESLGEEDGD